jgi:hypothetical protein
MIARDRGWSRDEVAQAHGIRFTPEKKHPGFTAPWAVSLQDYMVGGPEDTLLIRHRGGYVRVNATREAALAFAADIANGLLAVIELHLASLQGENAKALDILQSASINED